MEMLKSKVYSTDAVSATEFSQISEIDNTPAGVTGIHRTLCTYVL